MLQNQEQTMALSEGLTHFIQTDLLLDSEDRTLADDEELLTSGLIDSLGIMRLIVFIEETYSRRIPYEDVTIDNFRNVRTIVNYLQQAESE